MFEKISEMKETFDLLVENIDKCLSGNGETAPLALIEKEILLEKIRQLYVKVSRIETSEREAVNDEVVNEAEEKGLKPAAVAEPAQETKVPAKEDTSVADSVEPSNEDVKETPDSIENPEDGSPAETGDDENLFFDTEHESYEATDISEELEAISVEIEANSAKKEQPETPKPVIIAEDEDPDIFENLEIETSIEVESEIKDNSATLFSEEDDLLHVAPKKPEKSNVHQPSQRSLNDLFNQKKEDTSISGQYQHAKVLDLTKAISINDKFTYIKELFHNRGEDFSESVKMLNECKDMNEAFDCLEKLKNKYYWDSASDAYLSFCDLLRRKYS